MGFVRRKEIIAGWVGLAFCIVMLIATSAGSAEKADGESDQAAQPTSNAPVILGTQSKPPAANNQGPTLAPPKQVAKDSGTSKDNSQNVKVRETVKLENGGTEPALLSGARQPEASGKTSDEKRETSPKAEHSQSDPRPGEAEKRESTVSENDKATIPAASEAKPLKPIPEDADVVEIETASFNHVTPGTSTLDDVKKHWGVAKEIRKQNGVMIYRYAVEPFDHVEAMFYESKLSSIVIRLNGIFEADTVAAQLSLSKIRPVLISNEKGEILGQSYPERGVIFSFAPSSQPGKPSTKVAQIILEPVTAEPFLLRAETELENHPEASLSDLETAVKMTPDNGRARWLQARALLLLGRSKKALDAVDEALSREPKAAQYLVTRAQILAEMGRLQEATEAAETAAAASDSRPHLKARAICLLGDLAGSGPQPDYKRAMQHHNEAVKLAEAVARDPHPAIRQPAKEVLVDAHLGAAQDIAWGTWNNKEVAVAAWLKRASAYADELIEHDGGSPELRFRVAARALAACVGLQGKLDPMPWAESAARLGAELAQTAVSPAQKQECQREAGLALYDAVQVFQMRSDRAAAEKFGKLATEFFEATQPSKDRPADLYLLGRLYFRMGAICANAESNHEAAVQWFDKATATLQAVAPHVAAAERGRLGETLVSMGVSYWEANRRDKAVEITRQGVEIMEKAVQEGTLAKSALDVAYSNLATMHRQLGQNDVAKRYAEKVSAKAAAAQR